MLLSASARAVLACSCRESPSPYESFTRSDVVFVGTAKHVEERARYVYFNGKKEQTKDQLWTRFVIEDTLKGISGKEVTVDTGAVCGAYFQQSERYIVYAHRFGNTIFASMCSRTGPSKWAQDDLELIKAMLAGQATPRLFGFVTRMAEVPSERSGEWQDMGPMAGLTVKAWNSNGSYQSVTDNEGHFKIEKMPPGKYEVELVLPQNYSLRFEKAPFSADVKSGPWSQQSDFRIQLDGRIGGHLYDSQGRLVGDGIDVELVPPDSVGKKFGEIKYLYASTKNGQYEFTGLLPGRYVLGVSLAHVPRPATPYSTTYVPGGGDPAQAVVITLEEGQRLTDIDLHLPAPLETFLVTGKVLSARGRPLRKIDVALCDLEQPDYPGGIQEVETNAQGKFVLKGFKGRRYQVRASGDMDFVHRLEAQSATVRVPPVDSPPPITLRLNRRVPF